ncbi:helix-turn-helix domain-containing protein [Streptomyces sp. NPDC086091]|uniref:helix-turn-helix domain-containing protein n=1 Tax=Streptomyces sp. NPDC086091 TaxID=3365751 RepID=UPI0037F1EE80
MDTQNPSAHRRPQSRIGGKSHPFQRPRANAHPTGGVTHDNARHTTRFTVIGNHLAQHEDLSLLAIGLACHIQSLPTGAAIDIKSLAARFPEGAARIAAALRELEAHGYLRRTRERTAEGRIITRTVPCNQPKRARTTDDTRTPRPGAPSAPTPEGAPPERPAPRQNPTPRRPRALPDVPKPAYTSPAVLQAATEVLASLRREDPRLLLSAADADHLAPGVAAWLERDLTPTAVRRALSTGLPLEPLVRPAAFLAHRLTANLPPLPPPGPPRQTPPPPPLRHPLRNCDSCDHAYRGPDPHRCPGCAAPKDPPER